MTQAFRWFGAVMAVVVGIMLGGCAGYANFDVTVKYDNDMKSAKGYPDRKVSIVGIHGVPSEHPISRTKNSEWFSSDAKRAEANSYDILLSDANPEATLKKNDPQWDKWNKPDHATNLFIIANVYGEDGVMKRAWPLHESCWKGKSIVINVTSKGLVLGNPGDLISMEPKQ